jgi:hypothetical protein
MGGAPAAGKPVEQQWQKNSRRNYGILTANARSEKIQGLTRNMPSTSSHAAVHYGKVLPF